LEIPASALPVPLKFRQILCIAAPSPLARARPAVQFD